MFWYGNLLLNSQAFLDSIIYLRASAYTAQHKAHIPEAHTQTIIFPVLSSGSGGRKGRGGKKRGRGRGGGENPDLGEAESRFALRARARGLL